MKDITLNITEVQYHYLKSLAEAEVRSVEQLLYILLHKGAEWHFMESDISLEVLPHDYTKHEQEQYMDPERITTIRRTGHEGFDGFAPTLNFAQQAIDMPLARQRDEERDLAAELIQLAEYNELLEKRRDEHTSKVSEELDEFRQQKQANEESND